MPPKRLDTDLTARLEALRVWTQSNLAELRGRNGVGIHAKLRQLNSDEMSHYKFMYRYKERIAATPFLRTKLEAIDLMLQATEAEDVAAAAPSPEAVSVPDLASRTSRPSRPCTSVPSVHVLFVRPRSSRPPTFCILPSRSLIALLSLAASNLASDWIAARLDR